MIIKSIFSGMLLLFSTLAFTEELLINVGDQELVVTSSDLSEMVMTHYLTELPWTDGREVFSGVTIETLFNYYDLPLPNQLNLVALNDYSTSISKEEITEYKPIIAFLRNGEAMSVRDKGPYWVVFSLDIHPELDSIAYHSKMIWQLTTLQDQ